MTNIKNIIIPPVYAQPQDWGTVGNKVGKICVIDEVATIQGFECLFYNILQVVVFFAGIIFFFMFIYGGFKYLFSSGDSKKAAASSSVLTTSIIGIIGVIASWLILLLIEQFTGIKVTEFSIPN